MEIGDKVFYSNGLSLKENLKTNEFDIHTGIVVNKEYGDNISRHGSPEFEEIFTIQKENGEVVRFAKPDIYDRHKVDVCEQSEFLQLSKGYVSYKEGEIENIKLSLQEENRILDIMCENVNKLSTSVNSLLELDGSSIEMSQILYQNRGR